MRPTLLVALLLPLTSCSVTSTWTARVATEAGAKLGGCAVGDLDPSRPGPEIAAVANTGEVWIATRTGDAWLGQTIANLPGEMIQCAIGNADPQRPGDELVVIGMKTGGEDSGGRGAAHLLWHDERGWHGELIFEDSALIHAVAIGEGEVFVGGYSRKAHRLRRHGEHWNAEFIADLPGPGKAALADGNAVYFGCADGSLLHLTPTGASSYAANVVDSRGAGRSRLASANRSVLTADDDGTLCLVEAGARREIYREAQKLRGAVLADLDPASPGNEAATAGYEHRVTLLRAVAGVWSPTVLYESSAKLHHLVSADLDGDGDLDLVTCGYAGQLVVLINALGETDR